MTTQWSKRSPKRAVKDLLRLSPEELISHLTFDLSELSLPVADLVKWIEKFKLHFQETIIKKGLPAQLPSIAVFADRFTDEDEKQLRKVGAVLFDRSLPCNQDCQNAKQLDEWLARNRQIAVAENAEKTPDLPTSPAQGISPEDLKALNDYPPGMTQEKVAQILSAELGDSKKPNDRGRGR